MIEKEHSEMVTRLVKNPNDILNGISAGDMNLLHMAVGVAGEGGEILDAAKRVAIYGKGLTKDLHENIIEELGDLEFYMEGIRQEAGITRQQTLEANILKLDKGKKARYKDGYSDKAAIERADKQ